MTNVSGQPDRMAELAKLAAMMADRILHLNAAGTPIQPEQFVILVRAARALLDNDVPWPPSVEYLITEVAERVEQTKAADPVA